MRFHLMGRRLQVPLLYQYCKSKSSSAQITDNRHTIRLSEIVNDKDAYWQQGDYCINKANKSVILEQIKKGDHASAGFNFTSSICLQIFKANV